MDQSELARVQQYLRDKFGTERIRLSVEGRKDESAEVFLGDEFIGVLFRDEDEGEVSYAFNMAILEMDLPTVAGI